MVCALVWTETRVDIRAVPLEAKMIERKDLSKQQERYLSPERAHAILVILCKVLKSTSIVFSKQFL